MNRQRVLRYAVAVLAVAVALFFKFKASLLVELEGGFLILLAAVAVSTWYGGPGPGLLATILSALFSSRFSPLAMPAQSVLLLHPLPFVLFLLDGLLLSLMAAPPWRPRRPRRRGRADVGESGQGENPGLVLDALLGRASHDLRSPLNAILGWTQLGRFQRDVVEDGAMQRRAWEAVEQNARSQLCLIDQLLDAVAVLHGDLRVERQSVDFASEISAAVEALAVETRERGIRLSLGSAEGLEPVQGDARRLREITRELLVNAMEVTPRGGWIEVRLDREGKDAVLAVSDSGPGVAPGLQPYLFTLTRPEHWNGAGKHGRRGVGLVIVRRLVELHGGRVSASAGPGGHGACFTVRIPLLE